MIEIIAASTTDIPVIQSLAYSIWPVVYKEMITMEQINYMLQNRYSLLALEEQMKAGQQFFLAKEDNIYLGYAGVAPTDIETLYKLEKLYVVKDNHKKKVGSLLLQSVEQSVTNKGGNSLILQVNRSNAAVGFYKKMGFIIDREEDVEIGNGFYMNDYFMVKKIVK
jgi:diamine N-acetyltransferase